MPKKSDNSSQEKWILSIYVPKADDVEKAEVTPGQATTLHSRGALATMFLGEEKEVEASQVKDQWRQTIDGIVSTVGEWTKATSGEWSIDEVCFGLTLSAEGRLLFIAKAGAQASVQVKVKRVAVSA